MSMISNYQTGQKLLSYRLGFSKRRKIAIALLVVFGTHLFLPTASMAITGGENLPEFSSFEPVATTNMVNLSDGSFTYNIPLLEVPNGYPINLSYHSSDVTNEALASWVGLGWNINPGAINRVKKGFPDEYDGQEITYHNRMPANWTVGANVGGGVEIFSGEAISADVGYAVRFNNYTGLGTSLTGKLGFAGVLNLTGSLNNGVYGFDAEVRPGNILNSIISNVSAHRQRANYKTAEAELNDAIAKGEAKIIPMGTGDNKIFTRSKLSNIKNYRAGSSFGSRSSLKRPYPVTVSPYTGTMVELQFDMGVNWTPLPVDAEGSIAGSFARQEGVDEQTMKVYGYLYNEKAYDDEHAMMDYATEKEKVFEKRDNIIGYPIPNNDQYSLSGEALGGGFRAFRNDVGHYRKNKIVSEDFQVNAGADVNLASIVVVPNPFLLQNFAYTAGAMVGGAYHSMTVGPWDKQSCDYDEFLFKSDNSFPKSQEKYFYKFFGDQAGFFDQSLEANIEFEAFRAKLSNGDFTIDWSGNNYKDFQYRHDSKRNQRSTHILEHLNSDWTLSANQSIKYKVYDKRTWYIDYSAYSSGSPNYVLQHIRTNHDDKSVGEFVTTNNDGLTYVYGLPVYSRKEKQLQYSFKGGENLTFPNGASDGITASATITSGYESDKMTKKIGYENDNEFATTHLLTQILNTDYIDRTGNGPTSDDFGGFTKFNYYKLTTNGGWYPFRSPYDGVTFDRGSLSSTADDMGSYSYGERESYLLHSVVSKTHVAIFTLSEREDGKSAKLTSAASAAELLGGSNVSSAPVTLKKLDRIDLYAIEDCVPADGGVHEIGIWKPKTNAVPLKTVRFKYNYSLCDGAENSSSGKLTLEEVWFEYGGKLKSKISPYKFEYAYHDPSGSGADDPYNNTLFELDGSYYGSLSTAVQNPDYLVENSDRWGNYRDFTTMHDCGSGGCNEYNLDDLARFWPYVHQNPDPSKFDPAAYCLKKIILPSGGEIHVQYEQADYAYVQDQRAMMMVPLLPSTIISETGSTNDGKKYYLDLSKVGIDASTMSAGELKSLADDLFEPMNSGSQRTYFNFLYRLTGSTEPELDNPDKTDQDYIEGFARINGYGYESINKRIYFTFKGGPVSEFTPISYRGGESSRREYPRKVCEGFYKAERRMLIDGGQAVEDILDAANATTPGKDLANAFVNIMDKVSEPLQSKCACISPEYSYVRVQVPAGAYRDGGDKYYSKLGGGVRVKRLITYDPGIDYSYGSAARDEGTLYGNEYVYTTRLNPSDQNSPVISSGVATNEPNSGRRENALHIPIDKDAQHKVNAIFFGRDMYGQEAPLGESLLPAPSILYSKVTVLPVYKGSNAAGWEEHEFYTVKDYPFSYKAKRTAVQQTNKQPVSASLGYLGFSISYEREEPNLAQGYEFINYGMHGKPKSIKRYATDMNSVISGEEYLYHDLEDIVQLMGEDLKVTSVPMKDLGREVEVLFESRRVDDWGVNVSIGKDFTSGTIGVSTPPYILPDILPAKIKLGAGVTQGIFDSHATTTIVSYPALLKSTVKIQDGVAQYNENLMFDDHSGNPVVVRSYDDFYSKREAVNDQVKGIYLNQDFMGSWKYENFKSKFYNEDLNVQVLGVTIGTSNGKQYLQFSAQAGGGCSDLKNFVRGDFIGITSASGLSLYHVDRVDFAENRLYIQESQFNNQSVGASISNIHVIKSGYNNRLNEKTGNIVFFKRGGTPVPVQFVDPLDATHAFIAALNGNSTLMGLTAGSGVQNIVLPGPFSGMNMSTYGAAITGPCPTADPNSITISNVNMEVEFTSTGELQLKILNFDMYCGDEPILINCP